VLTARHVLKGQNSFKFVPAYFAIDGQLVGIAGRFSSWSKSHEFFEEDGREDGAWDFSLMHLWQPLGDHLGWFGVRTYSSSWNDQGYFGVVGYPSMAPWSNTRPSFQTAVSISDTSTDGDAVELRSENQDNSKGNSGGPLWGVWDDGPYIVGVTSSNFKQDFWLWDDLYVTHGSGVAMVNMVALAKLADQVNDNSGISTKGPDIHLV
jgi:hypothetical protein